MLLATLVQNESFNFSIRERKNPKKGMCSYLPVETIRYYIKNIMTWKHPFLCFYRHIQVYGRVFSSPEFLSVIDLLWVRCSRKKHGTKTVASVNKTPVKPVVWQSCSPSHRPWLILNPGIEMYLYQAPQTHAILPPESRVRNCVSTLCKTVRIIQSAGHIPRICPQDVISVSHSAIKKENRCIYKHRMSGVWGEMVSFQKWLRTIKSITIKTDECLKSMQFREN